MMKIELTRTALNTVLGISLLASVVPAFGQTDQPRNYAGVQAGTHDLDSWNADVNLGAINVEGALSIDAGLQGGVVLGREYTQFRYELEYQRGAFDVTDVQLARVSQAVDEEGDYQALTFNAYWVKHFNARFNAYLGLGIGWGETSLPDIDFANNCNCMRAASETDFVYQGRVGLEYNAGDQHNFFLQYTWLRIPGPASDVASPGVSYSDKEIGIAGLGYRYSF